MLLSVNNKDTKIYIYGDKIKTLSIFMKLKRV